MDGCGAVRQLVLVNATVMELPRDWLHACPALQLLKLSRLWRLSTVAADALRGATALVHFELTYCSALQHLPAQLFAENFILYQVNLSNNGLTELPADLFGNDISRSSE